KRVPYEYACACSLCTRRRRLQTVRGRRRICRRRIKGRHCTGLLTDIASVGCPPSRGPVRAGVTDTIQTSATRRVGKILRMNNVIVIGGGTNGLAAAALLARAGHRTIVIERTDRPGGAARTSEIAPGFRCSTLAHAAAIDPAIVRALALERHGLHIVRPEVDLCAIGGDRGPLVLWRDAARAADAIRAQSAADADRYLKFLESTARISRVLRSVFGSVPPSMDDPSA